MVGLAWLPVVWEKQVTERQIANTCSEFEAKVVNTFYSVPVGTINKLISSMPKHFLQLTGVKGGRIKY